MSHSRRDFLTSTLAGSVAVGLPAKAFFVESVTENKRAAKLPVIVSVANGYNYLDEAYRFLVDGGDTFDAALKVVQGSENDPNDESVGLGGHPNEEGVVELDTYCMHKPTQTTN